MVRHCAPSRFWKDRRIGQKERLDLQHSTYKGKHPIWWSIRCSAVRLNLIQEQYPRESHSYSHSHTNMIPPSAEDFQDPLTEFLEP